jgi:hypothetical protein
VSFAVESGSTGLLVRTALVSGLVFAWNTIRSFLGMAPAPRQVSDAAAANPTERDRS